MNKDMKVSEIKEHPRNRELFNDIKDSNPTFWEEFKGSIERFGIIEPLLVNRTTREIRSGNQRYKAALELGMATVPVVLVDDDASDDEIGEMIASNVFRRQIDPFKLFDYIAELRKGSHGKPSGGRRSDDDPAGLRTASTAVHKSDRFVSASDIWATLDAEQKEELKRRFAGDLKQSEGKLIAEMKKLEAEKLEAEEHYRQLSDTTRTIEEREAAQAALVEKLQSDIEELKLRDVEEELAERDAQIRALEKQKATLKKKLQEPDLNKVLADCIKEQRNVSVKLADILRHKDSLDGEKLQELGELMKATMATIRNGGKTVRQIGE